MHRCSFSKVPLVLICFFLAVALAVQAQNPPSFTPGQQVNILSHANRIVAADVNNDGFADIISLESQFSRNGPTFTGVVIYLNNGDGTFRAPFTLLEGTAFS